MLMIDMEVTQPLLSADAASALAWLVDAGLDVPVDDTPRRWLADAPAPILPSVAIPPVQTSLPAKSVQPPKPASNAGPVIDPSSIGSLAALETALMAMAHPLANGPQQMFSGAPEHAPLLVFAEMPPAPESDELQLLKGMLSAIGMSLDIAAQVCILPWPTRGQRPARDEDIALFSPFACRAIELMSPKLILALGGRAAALAEPDAAPATLRGRWLSLANTPMVATFTPAMLLRQPRLKADAWADLQRLAERMTL